MKYLTKKEISKETGVDLSLLSLFTDRYFAKLNRQQGFNKPTLYAIDSTFKKCYEDWCLVKAIARKYLDKVKEL